MQLHDRRHDTPTRDHERSSLLEPLPVTMRRALRWRLLFIGVAIGTTLALILVSKANAAGVIFRF